MATQKVTKKPSKKLQASKKKSLNKWLLLSGVAAVALIGAVIVRFSSAATITFLRGSDQMFVATSVANYKPKLTTFFYIGSTRFTEGAKPAPQAHSKVVDTIISASDARKSNQLCAKFGNNTPRYQTVSFTSLSKTGRVYSGRQFSLPPQSIRQYCTPKVLNEDHTLRTFVGTSIYVGVSGFYGTK